MQFSPLLANTYGVFPFVVEQHRRRLDEPLNEKNLGIRGLSPLQSIPQIFP